MTQRKPAHESVPDFIERQILEAQERGDFDGLAGASERAPGRHWWQRLRGRRRGDGGQT